MRPPERNRKRPSHLDDFVTMDDNCPSSKRVARFREAENVASSTILISDSGIIKLQQQIQTAPIAQAAQRVQIVPTAPIAPTYCFSKTRLMIFITKSTNCEQLRKMEHSP